MIREPLLQREERAGGEQCQEPRNDGASLQLDLVLELIPRIGTDVDGEVF